MLASPAMIPRQVAHLAQFLLGKFGSTFAVIRAKNKPGSSHARRKLPEESFGLCSFSAGLLLYQNRFQLKPCVTAFR